MLKFLAGAALGFCAAVALTTLAQPAGSPPLSPSAGRARVKDVRTSAVPGRNPVVMVTLQLEDGSLWGVELPPRTPRAGDEIGVLRGSERDWIPTW